MLFSYNWLNDYLEYKISPQELAEVLTMHAFAVESVVKKGDDWVMDIDVLTNRAPDCFSHMGVAREANALLGFLGGCAKKKGEPLYQAEAIRAFFSRLRPSKNLEVSVKDRGDSRLYHALAIDAVRVQNSPHWMRKRLEAAGVKSINSIVDISNYAMLDSGQPIHIFDADAIAQEGGTIHLVVRRAREGDRLTLLGGQRIALSQEDIVIANNQRLLALAGVKGGEDSGVKPTTKRIIIESANFNQSLVYKSARRFNIASDSAKRFGRGIPLDASFIALFKVVQLLKDTGGVGTIAYGRSPQDAAPGIFFAPRPPIMVFRSRIRDLIGAEISEEAMLSILTHLGFEVTKESEDVYYVSSPFWRLDCALQEDIAEEIARFYGLNSIRPRYPRVSLLASIHDELPLWRLFIRNALVHQGLYEIYSYSLVSEGDERTPTLLNPISDARRFLRSSLIPGLLEAVATNQGCFPSFGLFEIGKIFTLEGGKLCEKETVAGIIWQKDAREEELIREARGQVEGLFGALGFDRDDYRFQEEAGKEPALHAIINGERVGRITIPLAPARIKIKGSVAAFEMSLALLVSQIDQEREFAPLPKFPAVERDISLYVAKGVKAENVIQVIHEAGKELIEDVDLFDLYEEQGREQKSLAFHIIYRSAAKTLTDKEVNTLHKKIEQAIQTRFHAQVR